MGDNLIKQGRSLKNLGRNRDESDVESQKKPGFILNMNTGLKTIACLAASLFVGASASAATVYHNTISGPGVRTAVVPGASGVEIGDQVSLAGVARELTDWSFEYFVSPDSSIAGQAFLYTVGEDNLPGDLLYQSDIVLNLATGSDNGFGTWINEGFTPFEIPDNVIWSLSFIGIQEGDEYGLLLGGEAEIGSSGEGFYQRTAGGEWGLGLTPDVDYSFVAQFNAVPEPSTWALLVGGLGFLSFWRYRRKA